MSIKNNSYTFNLTNNTITLSHKFHTLLNNGDGEAYATLLKLKNDLPHMAIVNKPKAKRKNKTQMSFKKMEKYISCLQDGKTYMREFNAIREASKSQPSPYNYVRDWFRAMFSHYDEQFPTFDANGKIVLPNVVIYDELVAKRQKQEAS